MINEAHLRRLIWDYISNCHEDRIHDSLDRDNPRCGLPTPARINPDNSFPFRVSEACIFDMIGSGLPEEVTERSGIVFELSRVLCLDLR
jgi:hypothetical protein